MDLLKAQLDRISRQLSGLSATQKMLTAALVAIMVMTLIWWGKYAADPEMEPVLDQSFSAAQIEQITTNLASRGIHYSVSGDRILVPTDRKFEVLAAMSLAHLMPRDSSTGFDEMLKSASNPFNPDTTNQKLFNHGKEVELSEIIQGYFPNVAKADVMIDPTREMHVSGSVEPRATIAITMEAGASADDNLVNAAADLVQGAQAGLARPQIKVIVNGMPRRLRDTNDMSGDGDETLALQQKAEIARENRIKDYLSYIPDLKVFVTMKVNSTATQVHQTDYDGKRKVSGETESTSETSETSTPGSGPGADPGVVSNAIQTPGSVGGGGLTAGVSTNTESKETTRTENFIPSTVTDSRTAPGDVTIVAATVRVPMTYFEAIFAHHNPDAKAPTDADLSPLVTAELPKIRNDVMKCTGLVSEKDVAVETYMDATPIKPAEAQAASALSVSTIIGSHGRDLALGGFAVMSLFMVSMMVRKGSPQLASPVAAAAGVGSASGGAATIPGSLTPDEMIAGEAGGGTTLAGMELDDDTVRNQAMLEQVSSMVKENPEVAATLVKRWMNRT